MLPAVNIRALNVPGAWVVEPVVRQDDRGSFREWYRHDELAAAVGHPLQLAQANCSVSHRGVLRGLHYTDVPPGQAKYVSCPAGAVFDVVVDVRVGSPTFGTWDAVRLDAETGAAVYLAEGLAHGFVALTEGATVTYLCSTVYQPQRDRGIDPFDPDLGIGWPSEVTPLLSEKDRAAPRLAAAAEAGLLPDYQACQSLYRAARSKGSITVPVQGTEAGPGSIDLLPADCSQALGR